MVPRQGWQNLSLCSWDDRYDRCRSPVFLSAAVDALMACLKNVLRQGIQVGLVLSVPVQFSQSLAVELIRVTEQWRGVR